MTDLQKLLTNERSFQRNAALLGVLALLALSLPLSIARAIFEPEQIAAATTVLPPEAMAAIVEDTSSQAMIGNPNRGARRAIGSRQALPAGGTQPGSSQTGASPELAPGQSSVLSDTAPGAGDSLQSLGDAAGPGSGPGLAFGQGPDLSGPLGPGGALQVADPENPVDPGEPIDPSDPTSPVTPVDPVSPVPEPMTWMMMILGVGIVGGALRQARSREQVASVGQISA